MVEGRELETTVVYIECDVCVMFLWFHQRAVGRQLYEIIWVHFKWMIPYRRTPVCLTDRTTVNLKQTLISLSKQTV